jgi:molybdopterin synthase sulfur carrier subunit
MNIRVLYFARLREVFGLGEESVALPSPATLMDLLEALRARGGVWAQELTPGRAFRLAVNQDIAGPEAVLSEGDEVAVFPPVTGG